jgi:hypothetical protein
VKQDLEFCFSFSFFVVAPLTLQEKRFLPTITDHKLMNNHYQIIGVLKDEKDFSNSYDL